MTDKFNKLNDGLGESTYENPDCVENGFHLFFRCFLPGINNDYLVGCALAWKKPDEYYGCVARKSSPTVFKYKRGTSFDLGPIETLPHGADLVSMEHSGPFLRSLRDQAMETLKVYVSTL